MSTTSLTHLTSIHNLLTLTNHRNKNQHRPAKWWKEFSQLRRHVGKLITELETSDSYTVLSANSKKTEEARDRVEKRVEFMETWLVERCYLAFSNVVSDNQFAPLGLVLLGTLARTKTVLKSLRMEGVQDDDDDDDEGEAEEMVPLDERKPGNLGAALKGADYGEVVVRETILGLHRDDHTREKVPLEVPSDDGDLRTIGERNEESKKRERERQGSVKEAVEGKTPAKRPKKRKKRDAFDDLFDSLI